MYLRDFELHRPGDLATALRLLDTLGDDVELMAGGTELLLLMKLGLAEPAHLVDCSRLAELQGIDVTSDDTWTIGAATTHRQLERSAQIVRVLPALSGLSRTVANARVRAAGTIGGNLCFAEPHSDPATLLTALDASVELASTGGRRTIALSEFATGVLTTRLDPGEIMLGVRLPPVGGETVVAFRRLVFRERPVVNVAYVCGPGGHRLVAGAVGAVPARLRDAEAVLAVTPDDVAAVVSAGCAAVEPIADLDGSADYKRHLVGVLIERILADARAPAGVGART